jgi:hypothetical protein
LTTLAHLRSNGVSAILSLFIISEFKEVKGMATLDVHLGRPIVRGALTVFPIWNGRAVANPGYDLTTTNLTVEERAGAPVVEELVVTNAGRRAALVLEGELLEGGQQHRVAARSTIIPPGEAQVLEVRCVEENRWSGGRRHTRTGRRAPMSVRSAPMQNATWQRVRHLEVLHESGGATHFLGDALRNTDESATRLVGDLKPLPFQTGVLIGVGGYPMHLEVFDSPKTLANVLPALLHAAAVDALTAEPLTTTGVRARRFVDQVRFVGERADDDERIAARRTPHAWVTTLAWRGRIVHAVGINPQHELVNA